MSREKFMALVERLVQGGHVTGRVTCQGRIPFRCIDGDGQDLEEHLLIHNPHKEPPDVRPLSNGMFVAVPRSNNWRRNRAEQLLNALGLSPADYHPIF